MKIFNLTLFLLLTLLVDFSYGQNNKAMARLSRDAQTTMKYKEYNTAIELYEQLLKIEPDNLEYNYQLGVCYLNSPAKKDAKNKANALLSKVYQKDPNFNPNLEMNYGQVLHYQGKYSEAKTHYEKAKPRYEALKGEISTNDKIKSKEKERKLAETDMLIKQSIKKAQECDNGIALEGQPVNANVENLGSAINTEYPEYTPLVPADTSMLIFTSRREGTVGGKTDWQDAQYFEDIYSAKADDKGKFSGTSNININGKYHDAAAAISSDGKTLYFYHDNAKTKGDLYTSAYDETLKNWSEPKKLNDNINTKYQETALCISKDGNVMYFASDRPGGKGGLDIYMSKKENGDWGKAENLGEPINTEYDDDAPFVSLDDNTLYFSSMGHNTVGGYDIFKSEKQGGKWGTPKNMGIPINSPDDDVHLVITEDNKKGYYVSADDAGLGDKDIYTLTAPKISLNKLDKTGLKITQPPLTLNIPKPNFAFQVLFDFDRSTLRPKSKEAIDNLLKYLGDNQTIRIELGGHTCNIGTQAKNQVLSEQRAKSVANYLIERGVDANRIVVKGYNFEIPAVPNDTPDNRALNRRTEYKILEKE